MFENVRLAFGTILENLGRSSENHQKRRHQNVYIIKRTLHVSSKILFLCSRSKNNISLVRCAHSWDIFLATRTKKFMSSRHRVISSIYLFPMFIFLLQEWRKSNCIADWFCIIKLLQALIVKFSLCWIGKVKMRQEKKTKSLKSEIFRLFTCFWWSVFSRPNSMHF